ncbi:MAG: LLM class F420-dependent oxidoreductase [Acidimicrobiia bacterium]
MQFMYQYPEAIGTDCDLLEAGPVDEVARTAEAAGWMGFAFTEHPAPGARWLDSGGHQTLDPFVALGYAAAVTTRVRLLTYLAVAPYRNPFLLAKAAATVDKLSGGRFVLGMGTGYLKSEFHALGVDFQERNAAFDEVLDALPLHWSGQPFSYQGRHFEARDVVALPRPVQDPIPIWIGGNARVTRQRVVERAQGWMPLLGPPGVTQTARTPELGGLDELAATIAEMRDAASARGEAIDVLYPYLDPAVTSSGDDADRHRSAFAELEQAGITWVMVPGTTNTRGATLEFLEAFGALYLAS